MCLLTSSIIPPSPIKHRLLASPRPVAQSVRARMHGHLRRSLGGRIAACTEDTEKGGVGVCSATAGARSSWQTSGMTSQGNTGLAAKFTSLFYCNCPAS